MSAQDEVLVSCGLCDWQGWLTPADPRTNGLTPAQLLDLHHAIMHSAD